MHLGAALFRLAGDLHGRDSTPSTVSMMRFCTEAAAEFQHMHLASRGAPSGAAILTERIHAAHAHAVQPPETL